MSGADPSDVFLVEAAELTETLEQELLDLAQGGHEPERVNAAFRALHTLKGSGAMFGYGRLAAFLHEFESAFDRLRESGAAISDEMVTLSLEATDHAGRLIKDGPGPSVAGDDPVGDVLLTRLRCAAAAGPSDATGPETPAPPAAAPEPVPGLHADADPDAADATVPPPPGWRIRFRPHPEALVNGADPLLLLDELRTLGEAEVQALVDRLPPLGEYDPESCRLGWEIALRSDCGREAIEDVFLFVAEETELSIDPLASPQPAAPVAPDAPPPEAAPQNAGVAAPLPAPEGARRAAPVVDSVRVPAARLDELMDRVGELVIAQARLGRIAHESAHLELKSSAEEMDRLIAGLRDATMGARMVPFSSLLGRFRRLIHDLSAELGKEIRFETDGEDTELDKTMIEQLSDPLVHLIRNAVDHGLEPTAERLELDKPGRGLIRLAAEHAGGEVVIRVSDDGRGLDTERIRRRAETAGLIAPDQAVAEADLHRMIFEPGFSTAEAVTSLSGRGVGMDVVKRTVEGLRGVIDVDSEPGAGAEVRLRLPLTLAIVDGMLVRVGDERYVIPLAAVEECVEIPPERRAAGERRRFIDNRGSLTPIVRLREMFGVERPADPHPKVVIVASGKAHAGLVVDQILGVSQTVIKQLSPLHRAMQAFSGATILGDGAVALIVDVGSLIAVGQEQDAAARAPRETAA